MAYRELVAGDIIGCGVDLGNSHCLVVSKGFTNLQQVHSLCDSTVPTNTAVAGDMASGFMPSEQSSGHLPNPQAVQPYA